jgi:hypothetical protein
MKKIFMLFMGLFVALLLMPTMSLGADVSVSWNANTEADLAGYHLYQSTTAGAHVKGVFSADILKPATAYTVAGLQDGTYFWVLTAYDVAGNESVFSDEVSLKIDNAPAKPGGFKAAIKALIAWLKAHWGAKANT